MAVDATRRKHLRAVTGVGLVAVLALTGCGGADRTASTDQAPPSESPAQTIKASPQAVQSMTQLQRSRTGIDNADGLAEVAGFIWVKTDDGEVYKVDPANGKVVGSQHLDTSGDDVRYCQGIGTDGTWVWACAAAQTSVAVVRMDPESMRVVERYEIDKPFDQLKLPSSRGRVWVFSGDGSRLVGLRAGEANQEFSLPIRCNNLTPAGEALILTCPVAGEVIRLDPATGKVTARVAVRQPQLAGGTAEDVWVGAVQGVLRLDATTLRTKAVFPDLVPGLEGDIVADSTEVWVRLGGSRLLHRIDPATNQVTMEVRTPEQILRRHRWGPAGDQGPIVGHLLRHPPADRTVPMTARGAQERGGGDPAVRWVASSSSTYAGRETARPSRS